MRETIEILLSNDPIYDKGRAMNRLARELAAVPARNLASLDRELRSLLPYRDSTDIESLQHLFDLPQGWALQAVLASHRSGYVREWMTQRLATDRVAEVLPFLVIRMNDWVRSVRRIAAEAMESRLAPEMGEAIIGAVPYLLLLERWGRADHSEFLKRLWAFLRRPELSRAREAGMGSSDFSHVAVEEPEAHLHPKVQSRLAHWMVSLAMSNRRLIIETHSDHMVRRLRGLVARAGTNSDLEEWLLENVAILEVEQDEDGRSTVKSSRLTAEGGIGEQWPADFMDEASEEDSVIYYAGMAKEGGSWGPGTLVIHDEGDEPEVEK